MIEPIVGSSPGVVRPVLQIDSLRKRFGPKVVLDLGGMSFLPGVHFIVGQNGSGKTTFFKALAGIHTYEGKVLLGGKIDPHKDRMGHRRFVAYCPAEPLFPEYLTGEELIDFVCGLRGCGKESKAGIVEAFSMSDYLRDKVGTYSSGMKKKLGLAMALVGNVALVMLDEPFSALDQPSRKKLTSMIRQRADAGGTFFIASHLADLHAAFGDGKVHLMEQGGLREMLPGEVHPWLETGSKETE